LLLTGNKDLKPKLSDSFPDTRYFKRIDMPLYGVKVWLMREIDDGSLSIQVR